MTTAAILLSSAGTSAVGVVALEATTGIAEPWWIAVIVLPLAGFTAWLVKWNLDKQDAREKAAVEREDRREQREEKRAEQAVLQTTALQQCVVELRQLNDQQEEHQKALAAVPARVVAALDGRKST